MGGKQSKLIPPKSMIKKKNSGRYSGDYSIKLTPRKLQTFCEIDWLSLRVGWPSKGSLDKVLVSKVFRVITGDPGHPDQFSYIDCWKDMVLSRPPWLKACLEENCKIMMAQIRAPSMC